MTQQTNPPLETLILTTPKLSAESMSKLKSTFKTIHQFEKKDDVTPEALKDAEVWFSNYDGVNEGLKPEEVGKLRLVQLSSGESGRVGRIVVTTIASPSFSSHFGLSHSPLYRPCGAVVPPVTEGDTTRTHVGTRGTS